MIVEASKFVFTPPPLVSRARRILIKPSAAYGSSHPMTTSRETLSLIIDSVQRISDADIILLEGNPSGDSVYPIYQTLGYDFPRVLMLDVKDCIWVEVENPLPRPFAVPTFWIPNVVLSSDYLINVAPLKVFGRSGSLSVQNLLSLLPVSKYQDSASSGGWGTLHRLGIEKVIADLYFTLPFDLGIIDARKIFAGVAGSTEGRVEEYGKIFVGEPYEADREASELLGLKIQYLELIDAGKTDLEA